MVLHGFVCVHLYVINQIKSSKYPTNMLVKIKQVKQEVVWSDVSAWFCVCVSSTM